MAEEEAKHEAATLAKFAIKIPTSEGAAEEEEDEEVA
jgi:hypothetical protein